MIKIAFVKVLVYCLVNIFNISKNRNFKAYTAVNFSTVDELIAAIAPNREIVLKAAKETGAIVTAEEHNIIGGLGSAVAETVCEGCPVPMLRVGVEDKFGKSGKVPPLLEEYGLTASNIADKARAVVKMK